MTAITYPRIAMRRWRERRGATCRWPWSMNSSSQSGSARRPLVLNWKSPCTPLAIVDATPAFVFSITVGNLRVLAAERAASLAPDRRSLGDMSCSRSRPFTAAYAHAFPPPHGFPQGLLTVIARAVRRYIMPGRSQNSLRVSILAQMSFIMGPQGSFVFYLGCRLRGRSRPRQRFFMLSVPLHGYTVADVVVTGVGNKPVGQLADGDHWRRQASVLR